MKAVFTTKVDPTYDDLPEFRYHFPKTYLRVAESTVGDWIVYYEPRRASGDPSSRGGRQAYFATARVAAVEADPTQPDHFYAFVDNYIPLARPVGFREAARYFEGQLQRDDGRTNKGAFGRAVRPLSDSEYSEIVAVGMADILREAIGSDETVRADAGLAEEIAPFDRPIVERLVARPVRDAAFALAVKEAYDNTCAISGLRLINGGGRAEVQAAHIRPVAAAGPDSPRNGLALSGTLHWMFDRGLISVAPDHTVLISDSHVPNLVRQLVRPDRRLHLPDRADLLPHPVFLEWHRSNVFKG
jgi:putative restriction endonuclease